MSVPRSEPAVLKQQSDGDREETEKDGVWDISEEMAGMTRLKLGSQVVKD